MAEHEHENVPALPIAAKMRDSAGPKPHIGPALKDYQKVHALTVGKDSDDFWRKVRTPSRYMPDDILISCDQAALDMLYWNRPFTTVRSGGFKDGDIVWFPEGGLNASYNCLDRWAHKKPDSVSEKSVNSFPASLSLSLSPCWQFGHADVTRANFLRPPISFPVRIQLCANSCERDMHLLILPYLDGNHLGGRRARRGYRNQLW